MKIRKPDYYDRFQCIAGACNDSCCIGWEIDVDEEKRERYRNVKGDLGARLQTCIDWEEGHFILCGKEERCPFLNEKNLCDLIMGLGEDSLCEICREHPRYYEWYDDLTEAGVGLCCEAAARLILEKEEPARFVEEAETSDEHLKILFHARETAFLILQDRRKSIWQRLSDYLSYINEVQDGLDFDNLDEILESSEYYRNEVLTERTEQAVMQPAKGRAYEVILDICRELEAIDESWPRQLKELEELLADGKTIAQAEEEMLRVTSDREYEYEHLAVYFVYRYFMKCRMDGDIYSYGCLTVFCILLIRMLDVLKFRETGGLSKEDRVQNAKNCSKEIEYSEENLGKLSEIFWERGFKEIEAGL